MNILYLCQRIPYPPDKGDRIAAFHQIRHLSLTQEVTVGSLVHHGSLANAEALKKELGIKVVAPGHSPLQCAKGMATAMLNGKPLSLGYFYNPRLRSLVKKELSRNRFDGIIVFSSSMAQYVEDQNQIPRIMHFCDIDSQKWIDLSQHAHFFKKCLYMREGRKLLNVEQKIALNFDISCVISSNEAAVFRKCIPDIQVQVLENGVDVDYFAAVPRRPKGTSVVFIGVMDYAPNVEAVVYLANHVWKKVIDAFPDARFTIAGANPDKRVRKLAEIPGIEVTGSVPDIRPYLSSATLSVVPLAVARGIQNKILEAMAAGVPVLTTPEAAKGLPDGAERHVFVAERTEAFGTTLLELLKNPNALEQMGKAAQKFVRNNCTWDIKLRALDELLEKLPQIVRRG
jgi:sugar transferase (PEP-CTERM/EpsH1 system associated)